MKTALVLLTVLLSALAYEQDGNVLKLTDTDFAQAIEEFPFVLVKFFAPWCGHCKHLAPVYREVADVLNTVGSSVKLAEVDCTVHKQICSKYQIKGYPSLFYYSKESGEPIKFTGSRAKDDILNWIKEKVPFPVKEEEQKSKEEEEKSKEEESAESAEDAEAEVEAEAVEAEAVEAVKSPYQITDNLYSLTDETFSKALEEFDYVLVKFFAPWCGHCKKMGPAYSSLAKNNNNEKVLIAEVDCTTSKSVCSNNGVRGYPTLKFFVRGNEPIPYSGARTEEALNTFIEEKTKKLIPQEVPEVEVDPIPEEL